MLNAKDFGLPQNRERFFIIGNKLGVNTDNIFNNIRNVAIKKRFVLKDAIFDLPKLKPNNVKNNPKIENSDIGFFEIKYKYPYSEYANFINNGKKINKLYNHKNRNNNDRHKEIYVQLPQ